MKKTAIRKTYIPVFFFTPCLEIVDRSIDRESEREREREIEREREREREYFLFR
jgi:hypothetical protein